MQYLLGLIIVILIVIAYYAYQKYKLLYPASLTESVNFRCNKDNNIYKLQNGYKFLYTPSGWAKVPNPQWYGLDDCTTLNSLPNGPNIS